ncbi:MAG: hypothetical protein LBC68_07755 [Prevotellaceae bacterium]|jgi:hypothetical protein|nr:hypothetical protein [Prevotellaceae bacterium]
MLDKISLTNAIKLALDAESDRNVNPAEARQRMAAAIATAIDIFVKSGMVTGTCTTPAGAGTIQGTVQ